MKGKPPKYGTDDTNEHDLLTEVVRDAAELPKLGVIFPNRRVLAKIAGYRGWISLMGVSVTQSKCIFQAGLLLLRMLFRAIPSGFETAALSILNGGEGLFRARFYADAECILNVNAGAHTCKMLPALKL